MSLTGKDAVTTLLAGAIVAVYVTFLQGTSAWLISSARGTALAVLVLGIVACSFGTVADLYGRGRPASTVAYTVTASMLGIVALVAGALALITGSTAVLAILVAAVLALWLIATARHTFTTAPGPSGGRDVHEVIPPDKSPRP